MSNNYFQENENIFKSNILINSKQKEKHTSFIDNIPEQYKRREYIIDKLNCKKKNVE